MANHENVLRLVREHDRQPRVQRCTQPASAVNMVVRYPGLADVIVPAGPDRLRVADLACVADGRLRIHPDHPGCPVAGVFGSALGHTIAARPTAAAIRCVAYRDVLAEHGLAVRSAGAASPASPPRLSGPEDAQVEGVNPTAPGTFADVTVGPSHVNDEVHDKCRPHLASEYRVHYYSRGDTPCIQRKPPVDLARFGARSGNTAYRGRARTIGTIPRFRAPESQPPKPS